jgi:hypothetical protein
MDAQFFGKEVDGSEKKKLRILLNLLIRAAARPGTEESVIDFCSVANFSRSFLLIFLQRSLIRMDVS